MDRGVVRRERDSERFWLKRAVPHQSVNIHIFSVGLFSNSGVRCCRDCQSRAGLEKGLNFTVISNPQCVI